jgi:hypothetical protein
MDEKNWDSLRDILTDKLAFHHPTIGAFDNAEAMIAAVSERVMNVVSVHHGHNVEIAVSGDTAEGRWALHSFVYVPGDPGQGITRFANYHDHFRRINGEWKISAIRFTYAYDGAAS